VTIYTDNPADRLHVLLSALLARPAGEPNPVAWAEMFSPLPLVGGPTELARCMSLMFQLPAEIEAALNMIGEELYDRNIVMRWIGPVQETFGEALFNPGQVVTIRKFGGAELVCLEACNDVLHRNRAQRVITDSELENITELITELVEELATDGDIDPELRAFLLFHVQAMARAVHDFPVRGPKALEEALDQAVGALHRRSDVVVRSDTSPSAWRKFGKLIVVVAAVLQVAQSSLMLPDQIRQALEGPPPAPLPVVKVIQQPPPQPGALPTADPHR
jgi:hypothetical protein